MSLQTTIILISIGLLAGILSGFVGIGGGDYCSCIDLFFRFFTTFSTRNEFVYSIVTRGNISCF